MNERVKPGAVVLVDTNVIIEAHRTGTWAALAGAYAVETVEDCVTETQTGYQRRARERWIELGDLEASLSAVHKVPDRELAELAVRVSDIALDRGEESLWAHAFGRSGMWFLCGPDRASLRVAIQLRLRDRQSGTPAAVRTEACVHEEVAGSRGERDGGCRDRGAEGTLTMPDHPARPTHPPTMAAARRSRSPSSAGISPEAGRRRSRSTQRSFCACARCR